MALQPYESLGSFYLGREVDPTTGADRPQLLLYDARDLTTHAVCVGMTGSGKTGLCLSLLEEAALDGIPAIAIDPKGDIGNLLLAFPDLQPADFEPWVDSGEAARKGQTVSAYAAATAASWAKGLADWQQDGERIRRLQAAAEVSIYTPGSAAGRQLCILQSFDAPSAELRADSAALTDRVGSTVSAVLGLLGIAADPLQGREHILLSTVLHRAWSEGRNLDLAGLIQSVQKPGIDKIGVIDLDSFFPAKDRAQLAMRINNLLAAPGFAAWMSGEPLDIQKLLYTPAGKPRIAVVSIAHLNDAERMFVVTLLLGEVVAWMRRQSGTSSLRALLYMDEIFGYFPPTAMPPSKLPLLTLMKQARAFGLGVVLATQNPVDLDYKGLSNAGTWFIGRLQTERDKARVIDGLLGTGIGNMERGELEALLANLSARVFLMRNAHDDAPVLFKTRWALSYLRGPLTLAEIARLQRREPAAAAIVEKAPPAPAAAAKPVIPAGVEECYFDARPDATLVPRIAGTVRLHFVDKPHGIDVWTTRTHVAAFDDAGNVDWMRADVHDDLGTALSKEPPPHPRYSAVPASALRTQSYAQWSKDLAAHVYERGELTAWSSPLVDVVAPAHSSESDFRARVALALRAKRDEAVAALRRKYAPRLTALEDQVRRGEERIERERSQLSDQKLQTALSVGTSILGALLGRKKLSTTNVGRLGTAARSAGRIGRESGDVARAEENVETLRQRYRDLEQEFERDTAQLQAQYDPSTIAVERLTFKPRKSDIAVKQVALLWSSPR